MRRYLGIIFAFASLIAAIAFTYSKYSGRELEAERELDRVRMQRDYLERAAWVRANPDPVGYQTEANALFQWYGRQVDDHLDRFGGGRNFDEYASELNQRQDSAAKDAKDNPKVPDRKAHYEFVRHMFAPMRSGKYAPMWTATDKDMRLDVLTAGTQVVNGVPKVRLEVVLWGAQRELKDVGRNEEGKTVKKMVASADFDVKFKLADAKEKMPFEMNITGDPSMKTDYPERYVWAFPPQMVIGYFDFPLLPAESTKAEITFNVSSRSPFGGLVQASYAWKQDVPSAWKLRPGEKWEGAEVAVRPQEEIDPKGAAKGAKSEPSAASNRP